MPVTSTYDAFLSYNSRDHAIVERVAKELGNRQCRCFVDRWYLQPGRDWVEALERALSTSRSVAMFVGPGEMGRWQQRERAWALDQLAGRNDFPVIPVLLPGCEPPLGFMKQLMWIDLRKDPADSEQLDALAAAIRGEAVNREGRPEPRAMICPYRGLLAFREEDAEFFFGRQKYTNDLVKLIEKSSIVAVTGASGSGKSSVVRAGLIPQLRKRGQGPVWDILTMFPRENPLHSLADVILPLVEPELSGIDLIRKRKALADDLEQGRVPLWDMVTEGLRQQKGTDRLLLFVDQWEELYTTCRNDVQRNRFIQELLEATSRANSPLSVVLAVRWDFYGKILQNRPLLDRLDHSRLDLGPMDRKEQRSAIEGPASKMGLTFQDGLIDRILDDAGDEPGSLPLLEFVLEDLWKCRRGDGQLTHDAYGGMKGLKGAIATRAETVFLTLSADEQAAAEMLFRNLVQAGAKTEEDTRRRLSLHRLGDTSQRVARNLADERLLVTTRIESAGTEVLNEESERETVEVAHEELLRRWERLKHWVDKDRKFLQWRSRLQPLLEGFKQDPDPPLLRGNQLRDAQEFFPSRSNELDRPECAFINASLDALHKQRRRVWIIASLLSALFLGLGYAWDRANLNIRVEGLVESLLETRAGRVHSYLDELSRSPALAVPLLREAFANTDQNREPSHRLHAAYGLVRLSAADSDVLMFLIRSIPELPKEEGENLIDALSAMKEEFGDELQKQLNSRIENSEDDSAKNRFVIVAGELGFTKLVNAVCKLQPDPSKRTSLIHGFKDFPGDLVRVAGLMENETLIADARAALCIAVGKLGKEGKLAIHNVLKKLYQTAADGGTHSAARWALLQQGATEEELGQFIQEHPQLEVEPEWEHLENSAGLTMIRIPSHDFKIGSVTDDVGGGENSGWTGDPAESDESVPFPAIWISDREITVEQFELILPQFRDTSNENVSKVSDRLRMPVAFVSWYDAIEFCNALSVRHGLQPFYKFADSEKIERGNGGHIIKAVVEPEETVSRGSDYPQKSNGRTPVVR